MSAFITLGNAARYLAGEEAAPQEIAMFAALLESEADNLRAVKTWTEHSGELPGGVSFWHPPEQWRILKVAFRGWCEANGYPVEPASNAEASQVQPATGRRAQQILKIVETAQHQGCDPMNIPYGGKQRIKSLCLKSSLFTDSGFDHAWKAAVATNLIRMAAHDTFASRFA